MTSFSGIWRSDSEQFQEIMEDQVFSNGVVDIDYANPFVQILFLGPNFVLLLGIDFKYHEITPDMDKNRFHPEQLEDGFWREKSYYKIEYDYKVADGKLLLRRSQNKEIDWHTLPFRYESERSFFIKPMKAFQRMKPVSVGELRGVDDPYDEHIQRWIVEAPSLGRKFASDYRIADALVDSQDDARGFDLGNVRPTPRDDQDEL